MEEDGKGSMKLLKKIVVTVVAVCVFAVGVMADPQKGGQKPPPPPKEKQEVPNREKKDPPPPRDNNKGGNDNKRGKP